MKNKPSTPSIESQQEATKIAKATQKTGQTKEQTKLIVQGIEKGVALYKKQQKERNRQADKARKKLQKSKLDSNNSPEETTSSAVESEESNTTRLPWFLLAASWVGFAAYIFTQ